MQQCVLSHYPRPGDLATACYTTLLHVSPRFEFVLRPQWKENPFFRDSGGAEPWEWVSQPSTCTVEKGEYVFVLGFVWEVVDPAPPGWNGTCDWPMILVQKVGAGQTGWCKAWDVEVPLL